VDSKEKRPDGWTNASAQLKCVKAAITLQAISQEKTMNRVGKSGLLNAQMTSWWRLFT
jgi:hypothetical protein